MIPLAIAGCSGNSRASHAAPLARYAAAHPNEIELVAACDLDLDKAVEFCRSFGFVRPYKDLDHLLRIQKPDACVSVMPMEKIVEVGIKLLERCMPCVIEKPLGTSLAEIEKLGQGARDTQTPHMVSVNRRFMPYLNQAASCMSEQGPPRYVRATQVRHQRNEADFIWSTAIHVLDALRYVAGEVATFSVTVPKTSNKDTAWYLIALVFESGTVGQVEIVPTGGMVEESYEFFADGCRARVTAGAGPQRSIQCWENAELVIDSQAGDRK